MTDPCRRAVEHELRRRPFVVTVHALGHVIEWVDVLLDAVPAYAWDGESRSWERHGCWGCRFRLWRIWWPLQEAGDR